MINLPDYKTYRHLTDKLSEYSWFPDEEIELCYRKFWRNLIWSTKLGLAYLIVSYNEALNRGKSDEELASGFCKLHWYLGVGVFCVCVCV